MINQCVIEKHVTWPTVANHVKDTHSVGCLWQATVRFRRIFFFFVEAKRQIWLTSSYMLRKILRFSQAVACADSVVLEATCTSSGNKQKVRHFRKDCVSTLWVELTCENCKEFADHPFRVTHRTNEFIVYSARQTKQRVLQPNLRVVVACCCWWHNACECRIPFTKLEFKFRRTWSTKYDRRDQHIQVYEAYSPHSVIPLVIPLLCKTMQTSHTMPHVCKCTRSSRWAWYLCTAE